MKQGGMKKITKNFLNLEITKHNYKAFGIANRKSFLKYKRRALQDFSNNSQVFSKYYKPVKSSIWNPLSISIQGGKSKNARYNHSL